MLSAESHTLVFSRPRRTLSCLACLHNPQHAVMTGLNSWVVAEVSPETGLRLVEFFLYHGYVISFDADKALTHSSCLQ